MKKFISLFSFIFILAFSQSVRAENSISLSGILNQTFIQTLHPVSPLYLIEWNVGDYMKYNLTTSIGLRGSMTKEVTSDEGKTLWIRQVMDLTFQKEIIDIEIDKSTGEVVRMIRNGQDQEIPDNDLEIISQDYANVRVPAGTFRCLHVVARTKDVDKLEIWINPQATVMDGALKQVVPTGMMTLTLELAQFRRIE
jgi:hypothetical protein